MGEISHSQLNVKISESKRTKMIATIGPSTNSYEQVLAMIEAGANGIRLNFSHGTHDERTEQIAWVRKASEAYGKPVAIIADLQGPKIRLGDFDGVIPVQAGEVLELDYNAKGWEEGAPIPVQYDLSQKVSQGQRVYLYDGKVKTVVQEVQPGKVIVEAVNDGVLTKRKGINLPDTDFEGDILTKKDFEDIAYCATQDIDYVALSFVQSPNDIEQLRGILREHDMDALIIAKIETKLAIENLEAIIMASDGVMAARGDLATETMPESVPIVTRKIIGLAQAHNKFSIVATQMMDSMTHSPEPTRAEVSDVATAVIVGADCVMLSDETASGKFPLDAIASMKRIILYTQVNSPLVPVFHYEERMSKAESITSAVITLASQVGAKTIVVETASGATARSVASRRPQMPIMMVTDSKRVMQQLALVYGGKSFVREVSDTTGAKLTDWLQEQELFETGDTIVMASGKYPGKVGGTDTIKVRVIE